MQMQMKRIITIIIFMICFTSLSIAQTNKNVTDEGEEQTSEQQELQELEEEEVSYDRWSDPLYYQFEKMMPRVARSLGRLDGRISTLAVTDLDFSPTLDMAFRKVASAKLYGQLLIENPKLKLIKCNECNMIRSKIQNGILTVSRGLANQESRQKLAEKLDVAGFLSAMVNEEEGQLSIVVNVYDAQEGRIILSDVITGIPVPDTVYYNVYLGLLTVPITVLNSNGSVGSSIPHTAILVGAERSIRFAEYWMLAANAGIYIDNNSKLEEPHETITAGLIFDGTIGWEALSFMNNNATVVLMGGIGEFLSTQFNFSVYTKIGVKTTIGQMLTFNIHTYSLLAGSTNLDAPNSSGNAPTLSGTATSVTFGFQF